MPNLRDELNARWNSMFAALAAGGDVPPAQRLRTEGMMEAAALLEVASSDQLVQAMSECYKVAFGRGIADDFGQDWQEFYPFPQIPAMGRRAPVFPSTRE
ncbi:MAG: hypothetical protein GQ537_09680 [Gammaproteobacteria bacterium]|jgi:hypothetical protein|nr:hypothetical protein [Gammaproteobacteria bacterium]